MTTFVQIFDSMRFLLGLMVFFTLFSLFSCSTEFDINADKQDITVVYGLLNQSDSTHYIKITKAFLGELSAAELAQDPSLSSYGDNLTVTVIETINGVTGRVFTLQKKIITNKDSGIFYSPNQEVYFFKPVPLLNSAGTYKIDITNNITGQKTNATTNLIKDFSILNPTPGSPAIGFVNQTGAYGEYEAKWKSAKNGRIYDPYFRLHFTEVNKTDPNQKIPKYVDWHLSSAKSTNLDGGEELLVNYKSEFFYKAIQANVQVNLSVDRIIGDIDFIIAVGGDDLSIYMDLNKPTTSIVQERPAYTNVTNGIGIFSCRYSKKFTSKLSSYSVDKLMHGEYTSQLGFK